MPTILKTKPDDTDKYAVGTRLTLPDHKTAAFLVTGNWEAVDPVTGEVAPRPRERKQAAVVENKMVEPSAAE